jgi:beta-galactosidase
MSYDWDDVCKVTAEVTDKDGVVIPWANDLISFDVAGPGRIAAVDSGDNASHEPFQASERRAFEGRCVAYIKAIRNSGRIRVTASSGSMKGGAVVVGTISN